MKRFIPLIFTRHEPVRSFSEHAKSALGAMISMLLIGVLAKAIDLPLLVGPLGATAVLLFGYPGAALAQPLNIFGAYLVATIVSVIVMMLFPGEYIGVAIGVGATLFAIQTLRITHPPAGAVPMLAAAAPHDCAVLFVTLLVSTLGMVAFALVWHYLPPRRRYPAEHPGMPVQDKT